MVPAMDFVPSPLELRDQSLKRIRCARPFPTNSADECYEAKMAGCSFIATHGPKGHHVVTVEVKYRHFKLYRWYTPCLRCQRSYGELQKFGLLSKEMETREISSPLEMGACLIRRTVGASVLTISSCAWKKTRTDESSQDFSNRDRSTCGV